MISASSRIAGCHLIVVAIVMLVVLVSCHPQGGLTVNSLSPVGTPSPNSAPTITAIARLSPMTPVLTPSVTPTGSLSLPLCSDRPLVQVTRERVSWMQWSAAGALLFYRLGNSEEYRAFDPIGCTVIPVLPQEIPLPPFNGSGWTSFHLPEGVHEHQQQVSPSGEWIIFTQERNLLPTPTPGVGEGWGYLEIESDVFLLARGDEEPIYLGTMAAVTKDFVWTPDEQAVLLVVEERLPHTGYLWLADLEDQDLRLLFPAGPENPSIGFGALSPNGYHFVYDTEYDLYLYDLQTGSQQRLPISAFGLDYYWFLSEHELLIANDFDSTLDYQVEMYDLESDQLCHIYQGSLRIHSAALSADRRYLAVRWLQTDELYVLFLDRRI